MGFLGVSCADAGRRNAEIKNIGKTKNRFLIQSLV
jgi:hypothetical protein